MKHTLHLIGEKTIETEAPTRADAIAMIGGSYHGWTITEVKNDATKVSDMRQVDDIFPQW
jgi:hypothetical protein